MQVLVLVAANTTAASSFHPSLFTPLISTAGKDGNGNDGGGCSSIGSCCSVYSQLQIRVCVHTVNSSAFRFSVKKRIRVKCKPILRDCS